MERTTVSVSEQRECLVVHGCKFIALQGRQKCYGYGEFTLIDCGEEGWRLTGFRFDAWGKTPESCVEDARSLAEDLKTLCGG